MPRETQRKSSALQPRGRPPQFHTRHRPRRDSWQTCGRVGESMEGCDCQHHPDGEWGADFLVCRKLTWRYRRTVRLPVLQYSDSAVKSQQFHKNQSNRLTSYFETDLAENLKAWTCQIQVQRIYQLVQWRVEAENKAGKKLTAKELFLAFTQNLTVTHGEKVTESYCRLALQVHDSMLSVPSVRELLLAADEWFGKKSPLDSLYKLEAVSQVVKPQNLEWVLGVCFDAVTNRVLKASEISITVLSGKNKGQKGQLGLD